jgi:murein DD-endopeptidase MepM/ murein hydrolase activator NlpD
VVVVLFIYVMKFRQHHYSKPELVAVQQYSPEKNLYTQYNYSSRFDVAAQQTPIVLPFYGEWTVTQGHQGELTHRQEWRHAWDFEITDEHGKTFSGAGNRREDYYSYNQSVIAPADGVVQEILDGIDDNAIGDVNLEQNWGNTIIIRHAEKLYSKISHLRKGSFAVNKGDVIKRGVLLAKVGNSGHSPAPHIHFQLQENPYIGSHTRDYPIAKYIVKTEKAHQLKTFDRPVKGETVIGIMRNNSLYDAFNFVPGQTITFVWSQNEQPETSVNWEVKSDLYNQTYLECIESGAKAWFKNDGTLFYFTHFAGDDASLLYYFYMGAYKVALGYYDYLQLTDQFPLAVFKHYFIRFWQDFVAPFHIFMHADFEMKYLDFKDDLSGSKIRMASEARLHWGGKAGRRMNFEITVNHNRIEKFEMKSSKVTLSATETES